MITTQLIGDWKKCGMMLKALSTQLMPVCQAKLYEDGKLVVDIMQGHIDTQDLPWESLSDITVDLKKSEKIYLETGYLRDGIGLRKVKSSKNSVSYFIGASPWKTHKPSGLKFSDVMMYMEYGTMTQPPRPLVRPTYEEVKDKLRQEWKNYFSDIVGGNIPNV